MRPRINHLRQVTRARILLAQLETVVRAIGTEWTPLDRARVCKLEADMARLINEMQQARIDAALGHTTDDARTAATRAA